LIAVIFVYSPIRCCGLVEETMQPESVSLRLKDFNAKTQRGKNAKEI